MPLSSRPLLPRLLRRTTSSSTSSTRSLDPSLHHNAAAAAAASSSVLETDVEGAQSDSIALLSAADMDMDKKDDAIDLTRGLDNDFDSPGRAPRNNSILQIRELSGVTLYEKKCMLVNREIDKMGMGRYQWYLWALCGFGYFLDLLWAQAFGLILSPLQQEFGFASVDSENISVSFSAGLTAGAAFWGIVVDIIGRRWAFNLTVLFASVFGLALAGANDYNTFLILTAFVGLGIGGNIPIDTTITLEFIPQAHRRLLPFLSVFQPIGVVITAALALAFIPKYGCKPDFLSEAPLKSCNVSAPPCCSKDNNWGWRYLVLTIGAFTIFIFLLRFVVFNFRESPKYLIYRGYDEKAIQVIHSVAKFNGQTTNLSMADFESVETPADRAATSAEAALGSGSKQLKATYTEKFWMEMARYKLLFNGYTIARLTILVWLIYACDYFGFTVAGYYLPRIVAEKDRSLSLTIEQTYRSYVYIYLPGIAGVLLGVLGYDLPRVGRKYTMVISSGLMAASLFIFSTVNDEASNIGVNAMEYFFQSMFNAVLYGWTPEAFPAPIRGTACGIASFWGRLFSIVSPIAAGHLLPMDDAPPSAYNPVLYLAGGITLGCPLLAFFLPSKIIGGESM